MSDLKVSPGQPVSADKWNQVIDRLPGIEANGNAIPSRVVLCRTTEDIEEAAISDSDTEDSVYHSGTVQVYGIKNNGDSTFSPALLPGLRIMLNTGTEFMPSGTEVWAVETFGGHLVAIVWACEDAGSS